MSLSDREKFNLIRPLPDGWPKDDKGIPFLKKENFDDVDWNNVGFTSTSNIKPTKNKEKKIILNFQFDKSLNPIYNNIFDYARKAFDYFAVTTPDFSAYTNMELWKIEENVVHSLWCGAWLQYLGLKVIPTVTWANRDSYDICFNHIEQGSVVAISTIGISSEKESFLNGFNAMIERIKPSLILVRGNLIDGMEGKFIFIDFTDTFEIKKEYEQLYLFSMEQVQIIRKEDK